MEDYLSEKEQWEWVKAQVRSNGPWAIVAVVLVFAGVAGWRWWQEHQDASRLQANARLMQMLQSLEHGDRTQALSVLGQLEREDPDSPYTDQAKLLRRASMWIPVSWTRRPPSWTRSPSTPGTRSSR